MCQVYPVVSSGKRAGHHMRDLRNIRTTFLSRHGSRFPDPVSGGGLSILVTVSGAAIGIDYGTSNTVAVLRHADGKVRPLLFDSSPLVPSAVFVGDTGRLLVGQAAERSARL